MTDNFYQAPESTVLEREEQNPGVYIVSLGKLLILYIVTLGLYELYWFYKHWQQRKLATGEKVWPLPRAIFSIFFAHSLFRGFDSRAMEADSSAASRFAASRFATPYVLLCIIQMICEFMSWNLIGEPFVSIVSLISFGMVGFILYKVQMVANIAGGDSSGESNREMTGLNVFWIVFGVLLWVLAIIGFYETFFGIAEY